VDLNFRAYGTGPPLVILHGLFGSLNNWHSHATFLGGQFRVFTVDQRNHGGSPHSPVMNYAAMAEDLQEFIHRNRIAPVHLLGHSMGGRTAMQYALSNPGEVQKLVVVDIRPQGDGPLRTHILNALRSVDFSRNQSREDVDAALASMIPDPAVRQFLATNLKRSEDGSYRWKINLDAIAAHYDEIAGPVTVSGQYQGPVLFLTGGRSSHVGAADRPGILTLFPNAHFLEIPHAGHWVHADAPAEFRRILLEFLRR